ncbi:MAG TPA: sensor domain-containing diguanylate cyclase [Candidatus Udaeobacter sp.]|jgi:diguanylate cyclase (GGDEF)-like protein|nr:sensor domain-containing diguanylate cyclase [Candidatus Udaeobacter sp.]
MSNREPILETLLELSSRPAARSRPALIELVLRAALQLSQSDGATVLASTGRPADRTVLLRSRDEVEESPSPGSGEFVRLLMRAGRPVMVDDLVQDQRFTLREHCPGVEAGPAMFVPLRVREQAPGTLAIYRARGAAPFTTDQLHAMVLLSTWAATAIENLRLAENVERLAVTDDLTQVYNYRFLKTALRREIKRAGRFRQELSLAMIDVDNLKGYNDRHGHLRGSFLLREIARLLAEQVRSFDLVAKYGGDEFTLILPQTSRDGAIVVGERVRAAVEGHTFPLAQQGQITVSIGIAMFPYDAADASGLIQASDRALYQAKQQGRNRIETVQDRAA